MFPSTGKGLGKSEDGITTPIKPRIKLDTYGVGHKVDLTSDWWCQSFNKAAQSLEVHISEDSVIVKKNKDKAEKSSKIPDSKAYNAFIKAGTQTSSGAFISDHPEDEAGKECDGYISTSVPRLSDEELFTACGGLTAHKAARHGFKMSGKLKRVQKQEQHVLQECDGDTIMLGPRSHEEVDSSTSAATAEECGTPDKTRKRARKCKHKKHDKKMKQCESV